MQTFWYSEGWHPLTALRAKNCFQVDSPFALLGFFGHGFTPAMESNGRLPCGGVRTPGPKGLTGIARVPGQGVGCGHLRWLDFVRMQVVREMRMQKPVPFSGPASPARPSRHQ